MSEVIVLKASESDIERDVRALFQMAGGVHQYIRSGDAVLIKPNFVTPKGSETGTTTDPRLIEAVIRIVLSQHAKPIIGEGVPFAFDGHDVFRKLGMYRLAEKYGVELVDFDKRPFVEVAVERPLAVSKIPVSKMYFEVNRIINLPVMKTHSQTTVTLGMKNLKGFLPSNEKLHFHQAGLSKAIVDLNSAIRPTFTIIDGIIGMEGNGPTNGRPKRMDLLLGSSDILALETTGARIMGFTPSSIDHLRLAEKRISGELDWKRIRVIGEDVESVRRSFSLPLLPLRKWLVPWALRLSFPFMQRHGIDLGKIARSLSNLATPYPTFQGHCEGCAKCVINCPQKAIRFDGDRNPVIDKQQCQKCYVCDEVCVHGNVKAGRKWLGF